MQKRRTSFYIAIVIVIVTLGFLREFIFVNLNYQLGKLYYLEYYHSNEYNYQLPASLPIFGSMSYIQLYWTKWFLSGLFALLYFGISYFALRRIFPAARWVAKITIGLYVAVFAVAVLCYLYGFLPGKSAQGYSLALDFMHMLQSPIPLMILIPAFKLAQMSGKQS